MYKYFGNIIKAPSRNKKRVLYFMTMSWCIVFSKLQRRCWRRREKMKNWKNSHKFWLSYYKSHQPYSCCYCYSLKKQLLMWFLNEKHVNTDFWRFYDQKDIKGFNDYCICIWTEIRFKASPKQSGNAPLGSDL